MDLHWYLARGILPLGRLTGHRPTAEERNLCRRLAHGDRVEGAELGMVLPAAAWAWCGTAMTAIACAATALFLDDAVGWPLFAALVPVATAVLGLSLGLFVICYLRDSLLDHADERGPGSRTGRIAARCAPPRAYDFWLAAAAATWPTLWSTGVV
ncbi:hypothetical protein [Streptomyces sp. NPDC005435]|uniref:hypothetical protein n=1 Tax=Streptomyces sp. NPDC005435 TaxID=3154464 RepID=UPI003455908A